MSFFFLAQIEAFVEAHFCFFTKIATAESGK